MWSFQENIFKTKSKPLELTFSLIGTVNNASQAFVTIKNNSDDSVFDKYVDWGDGNIELVDGGTTSHSYSSSSSYNISIASNTAGELDDIIFISVSLGGGASRNVSGNISNFAEFINIETIIIADCYYSGDISSLSTLNSLKRIEMGTGSNTITGDIGTLSSTVERFYVWGNNTLSGDINFFNKSNTTFVSIGGNFNTISGDLDLTSAINLTSIQVYGANTITGDVVNFPDTSTLISILISGNNTLYGNISDLFKLSRISIIIAGQNTITGDIISTSIYSTSTVSVQINIRGNNTIFGEIDDINENIGSMDIQGLNIISGNTLGFPIRNPATTSNSTLRILGNNTITGDIANLILNKNLRIIEIDGDNTINGDVGQMSTLLAILLIYGNNTISTASTPLSGGENILDFRITGNSTLSSTNIDDILIHLESVTLNGSGTNSFERITINSGNNRTSASDAAVTSLKADGFAITINNIVQ